MSTRTTELEQELLQTENPREKVDVLNKLSIEYMSMDRERAREYNKEALTLAESSDYPDGTAFAQYAFGMYLFKKGNYRVAITRMMETLKHLKDSECGIAARLYNGLGLIYYAFGDYDESMNYYLKSLLISEKLNMKSTIAGCLHNIGMIYRRRSEFETALEYANRALKVLGDDADNGRKARSLNEIGLIKIELNQFRDALSLFKNSLELAQEEEDSGLEATARANIGLAYQNLHEYEEAAKYNHDALSIYEQIGDKRGLVVTYINLAIILGIQEQYHQSIKQLETGLELAESIEAKPLIFRIHEITSDVYEKLGLHLLALRHYKLFHDIKQQVFNENSEKHLRRITADFELEKVLQESELHRLKNIELARAQQTAHLGIWEWDRKNNIIRGSDEFFRIIKITTMGGSVTGSDFLESIHPDDALVLERTVDDLLEDGKPFENTVRLNQPSVNERIVLFQAEINNDQIDSKALKVFGTVQDVTERRRTEQEREKTITQLQDTLSRIKSLSGLIPICANCKKIRNDKGLWNHLEEYIMEHSEAVFSHGICPDCRHDLYPEIY